MTTTLVRDRHHASRVGIVQRQRLFTEDVLAGLQALDRKWSVERVRSDVADPVDIRPRQHLFQVRVGYRNSVLLTEGLSTSLIHIYCSQHLAVGNLSKSLGMEVGHASCAENCKTDNFFGFAHDKNDSGLPVANG